MGDNERPEHIFNDNMLAERERDEPALPKGKGVVAVVVSSNHPRMPVGALVRYYPGTGEGESVSSDEHLRRASIWDSCDRAIRTLARVLPRGVSVELHEIEVRPLRARVHGRR